MTQAPVRQRARRWRMAGHELVSALLFLPLLVASGLAIVGLPWWARWVGARSWTRARAAGAVLPVAAPRRGARPVALLGVLLAAHLAAFLTVVSLGSMGLALLVAPLVVRLASQPVYELAGWHPTGAQAWLLVPLGALVLWGLTATLGALARLRFEVMGELAEAESDELVRQVHELSASRASLVDAFESERRRIERDLHDGAQQRLVGLAMTLGMASRQAGQLAREDERVEPVARALAASQDEVEAILRELRSTVRGIHPQVLADHGLFAALGELAGRPGQRVLLTTSGDDGLLAGPIAAGCYFAVTEAIANAGKHAGTDEVTVDVRVGERLRAEVGDHGRGGARLDAPDSSGLRGLAERMASLGGRLELYSPAGQGTRVVVDLPLVPGWPTEGE